MTTFTDLQIAYQQKLKFVYKNVEGKASPQSIPLKWFVKNHTKVAAWLDTYYTNISSRKSYYIPFVKALLFAAKDNKDEPIYKKYSVLSTNLNLEQKKIDEKQDISEKDKKRWIDLPLLEKTVIGYMSEMDRGDNENYRGLAGALYVLMPPIRLDYGDMKIIKRGSVPTDLNNYIKKIKGRWVVFLRKYKTYRNYGAKEIVLDSNVSDAVSYSLQFLPRDYLFAQMTDPKQPLGDARLGTFLTNQFGFSAGLFRKIYITYYWNKWNSNLKKTQALAKRMLHDRSIAESSYRKMLDGDMSEDEGDGVNQGASSGSRNVAVQAATATATATVATTTKKRRLLGDAPFVPREYSKKYKQENPEKVKEQNKKHYEKNADRVNARKILSNLNRGLTKSVLPSSAEQYGIVQHNGVWSSTKFPV